MMGSAIPFIIPYLDKDSIDKLKHGVVVDGRKVKIVRFKVKKKDKNNLQKKQKFCLQNGALVIQ